MTGSNLEVYNPFFEGLQFATVAQLDQTYKTAATIIENLDDLSLKELSGGSEEGLEQALSVILEESYSVLYGKKNEIKETSETYIQSLSNSIEDTLRKANLNYFIASVMPEFQINWHHLEWGQLAQQYKKLCIIAPRDHGKSFFYSLAYPIWKLYRYSGFRNFNGRMINDDQHHRGFIITNEMQLAIELLEKIKDAIEENSFLRDALVPSNNRDYWSKQSIRVKNGARLGLKSYGGSFRGRHPGWIVVDDFLKDNVIYSSLQRKKATDYFHSVIMNAIVPGGQVIVVGTPFHSGDLYGDLKEKRGKNGWRVMEYPAISPEGRILWGGRYNFEALMERRESQGNIIFSRESLCRPIVSDSSIFPWEILKKSLVGMSEYTLVKDIDSFSRSFSRVITACDLALSSSVGADYSVFTTWGIDDNMKEMWLLHMWRGKGKRYEQQISIIKSIHRNFRSDLIVIEANQFQKMFADMASDENLPVVPHTTTASNKNDLTNGLPGLALMFERGRIKMPYGDQFSKDIVDLILSEFSSVAWTDKGIQGIGGHDDCTMSTWLAKRGMDLQNSSFGLSFLG